MTTRNGNRFALSQVALVAMAETRLAARAAPGVFRQFAPMIAWAVAAVFLGTIVGFAAVVLPPLGAFGIVAAVGVVLLWVTPEVPLVYPAFIRKTFFVMLIADLCVPYYYTVQFGALPWISARRVATFALIAPFLLALAASSEVRGRIATHARSSPLLVTCASGYLAMAIISIFSSPLPGESLSALTDSVLSWYVPLLALLYLAKDKDDSIFILKVMCFCAIFNTGAGVLEFYLKHRFFADVIPKSMLASLIENNPVMQVIADNGGSQFNFRNGLYRAASTFIVALSFGEFEIIVIPIGLFFALHRRSLFEKYLGWAVVLGGMVGIFVSGSRGAYVGFLASTAAFVTLWAIRKALTNRASLAPALVGLLAAISFAVVIVLILYWKRAHNLVLGGGAEMASTEGRWEQWREAWPLIKSNPITGHGFVTGGFDIGSSIDSYVLSLLLETGIPGLVFFAGLSCLPIWYGVRGYLTDLTELGALQGALACSFIAFTLYRLVLSQRENHMLMFSLLAIVIVLNYEYAKKHVKERRGYRLQRKPYYVPGRPGLEATRLRSTQDDPLVCT
jgi:O-antigen ligase